MTSDVVERLREELAPETDADIGPWIKHDGGGRPQKPGDFVEVRRRDGSLRHDGSAFIRWVWADDDDLDETPDHDVIEWRHRKRRPFLPGYGKHVPDLLAEITRLRAALAVEREECAKVAALSAERNGNGCAELLNAKPDECPLMAENGAYLRDARRETADRIAQAIRERG